MQSIFGRTDKGIRMKITKILFICIQIIAILHVVYLTGGTKKVFVQLMYIPIILSALFWGSFAGLATGLVCGILSGPLIPLDVYEGTMQDPLNWISRAVIFSLVGFLTGYLFDRIDKLNSEKQDRHLKSTFYDLPNVQKLLADIDDRIRAGEHFKLVSIKLTNLYDIEKYIDNKLIFDIVENLANQLAHFCGKRAVYSYEKDELIVLICDRCMKDYEENIRKVIEKYDTSPVLIGEYKIRVSLKAGIYEYTGEDSSPIDIYNKARIAYEQGDAKKSGIYYYDAGLENKRRENQNITGELLESIEKNKLFVVYQPEIDIVNNRISGVEALVRWKKSDTEIIEPNTFIPIAEEIGFISQIARFVLDTVTTQIKEWKDKGINIRYSINLSVTELLDENYMSWASGIINGKNIESKNVEIEITERAIAYSGPKLLDKINFLKDRGFIISIDDFGTGYNSLMRVGEIPLDKLKIDKYFINRINRPEIAEMVKHVIEYAHTFGKTVLAEGVETEEQLEILKNLNCDEIQGFFYSKPLLPQKFEEFYKRFK